MGGGVALGAAAVLAAVRPAYALATTPITGAARVGATFDLYPFASGTTYPDAVRIWNATTGTTMRCWKVYYQVGKFPPAIDAQFATMIDHGIQALISFKPAIDTKTSEAAADRKKLAAAVKMLHKHGLLAEVCL